MHTQDFLVVDFLHKTTLSLCWLEYLNQPLFPYTENKNIFNNTHTYHIICTRIKIYMFNTVTRNINLIKLSNKE